jgi:hypothetical protein
MAYIHPPSGFLYGFPKLIPDDIDTADKIKLWLVENGYPKEYIISFGELLYCNFYESMDRWTQHKDGTFMYKMKDDVK